jgi:hypothetical protein
MNVAKAKKSDYNQKKKKVITKSEGNIQNANLKHKPKIKNLKTSTLNPTMYKGMKPSFW